MKSFVDQWFMEEGDLVLTVESSGKQYFIKAGWCGKENGQGEQDPSQYGGDKGENNYQFVFVAEDGDRVVLKARFRWEGTGDPANPRIYFGYVYEWSCH
jgi:hypothetical protein